MKVAMLAFLLFSASAFGQSHTHPVPVIATRVGPLPGALVCQDEATIQMLFYSYADYSDEVMRAVMTHGQSMTLEGVPWLPKLARYGCVFVAAGKRMTIAKPDIAPPVPAAVVAVQVRLTNGHTFHGVTQTNMFVEPEK